MIEMKILQVCSKIPFPPKDGGSIAMNILTEGLIACGNEVKVLAVNTPKHFTKDEDIDPAYRKRTSYRSVFIDTSVKPLDAFLNLFSSASYNISRFYSKDFEHALIEILGKAEFDIVHLETLWVAPYVDIIRKHSKAKIVLRSQNVEYSVWERVAAASSNPLKRMYLGMLARRLKKYELDMLNRYDAIAPITEIDGNSFKRSGCKIPMINVPFGLNASEYEVAPLNDKTTLFHIGAMDWIPNIYAIEWLLENVWDEVARKHPALELHLAGRNMPKSMKGADKKNVTLAGEVKDAKAFMRGHSIMVAPLFSGGGMRIKIIEAMAMGKVVISTKIGVEGISAEHGKHVLLAEDPQQFIALIDKCVTDKEYCKMIGSNARKLVEEKYDNRMICEGLSAFYHQLAGAAVTA
jgi:glycosyltransferase involved in cell wall biosynthesis